MFYRMINSIFFYNSIMKELLSKYKFYLTYFPAIVGTATAFLYFEQNVPPYLPSTCSIIFHRAPSIS